MTSIAKLKAKYEQALADGTPIKLDALKDGSAQFLDPNLSDSEKLEQMKTYMECRAVERAAPRPMGKDVSGRREEDYWTMMRRERDERDEWLRLHPNEAIPSDESDEQIEWDKLKFPNGPMALPKALYEKMESVLNSSDE